MNMHVYQYDDFRIMKVVPLSISKFDGQVRRTYLNDTGKPRIWDCPDLKYFLKECDPLNTFKLILEKDIKYETLPDDIPF